MGAEAVTIGVGAVELAAGAAVGAGAEPSSKKSMIGA